MMNIMLPPVLIISFLGLCLISFKERALDEREQLHILKAGRIAYLAGLGTLIFAIIWQNIKHSVDPWLLVSATLMIIVKFASKIYSNYKN